MSRSEANIRPTFVLIPGAWLGAWSWYPVARLLSERGYGALPLTLPGLAYGDSSAGLRLSDAIDFIVNEVEHRDLRHVVLVSHSWGGYPATGAAHRLATRLSHVMYYNAVVPAQNTSMADENEVYGQAIHEVYASTPDGTIPLTLDVVRMGMMQDESPALQQLVFDMMLPQPIRYMVDTLDVPDVTKIGLQTAYILGIDDHSLARPGTEFATRLGVQPLMVPGSHMAMLSRAETVADALTTSLTNRNGLE